MTTPLASEPMPDDGQVPISSILVDRLYQRLPEVYRTMDGRDSRWAFKRYLYAALHQAGLIDDTVTQVAGDRPVGPAAPEPWGLQSDELAVWRAARQNRISLLGDPQNAPSTWLSWMAQLVGAYLDPAASLPERRDTISFATSGYRAGTRQAIADAARSALTGSRYVQVLPRTAVDGSGTITGGPWDVTIVTRGSETPDPNAVLGAVVRKGVKPAGVRLWTHSFEASWAAVEAQFPAWQDWNAATWQRIEEAGLSYADVPDNLAVNPSFESGTTGWTALNATTLAQVTGGADSIHAARCTSTTTATHAGLRSSAVITGINDERDYEFSISLRPHVALVGATMQIDWQTSGGAAISTTSYSIISPTNGQWSRVGAPHTAPTNAAKALIRIDLGTVAVGEYAEIDAVLFRLIGV
jgi:hypothetical protein